MLAQAVSSVVFLALFLRGRGALRLKRSLLGVRRHWLGKTFRIGVPAALGNSSVALGFVVMMSAIGNLDNAVSALSGYGIADRLFGLDPAEHDFALVRVPRDANTASTAS